MNMFANVIDGVFDCAFLVVVMIAVVRLVVAVAVVVVVAAVAVVVQSRGWWRWSWRECSCNGGNTHLMRRQRLPRRRSKLRVRGCRKRWRVRLRILCESVYVCVAKPVATQSPLSRHSVATTIATIKTHSRHYILEREQSWQLPFM